MVLTPGTAELVDHGGIDVRDEDREVRRRRLVAEPRNRARRAARAGHRREHDRSGDANDDREEQHAPPAMAQLTSGHEPRRRDHSALSTTAGGVRTAIVAGTAAMTFTTTRASGARISSTKAGDGNREAGIDTQVAGHRVPHRLADDDADDDPDHDADDGHGGTPATPPRADLATGESDRLEDRDVDGPPTNGHDQRVATPPSGR